MNKILDTFVGLEGRVGIFGGSFDPVHNGHLEAALCLTEKLNLDQCVFIPAKQNPLKVNAPKASDEDRVAMLQAAIEPYEKLKISLVEIKSPRSPSYTIDTLSYIKAVSKCSLFLLIGSDNLSSLHLWKDISIINKLATIVPYLRKGDDCKVSDDLPFKLPKLITVDAMQISSTEIRARFADKSASALPPAVAEYISAHNLYLM